MTEMMMDKVCERIYGEDLDEDRVKVILLRKEELNELYKKAAEIGAATALSSIETEKKKAKKQMKDNRLRNTKLLMKNYRMLKANIDYSVYREDQLEESAADILNSMVNAFQDDVVVDSIRRSAKRTAIMVTHVDKMMGLYKSYCENAVNYLDQRRYEVICDMYISETRMNALQIAEKHNISKESVYADIKAALETISALIFGIDGLNVM